MRGTILFVICLLRKQFAAFAVVAFPVKGVNDYSLAKSFGAGVLRPSNPSGRVSRIPDALISAATASRRKLLVAARHVVFCFRNVMRVVVQSNFLWLEILPCF